MRKQRALLDELLSERSFLLIILDACRADYFEKVNTIDGDYQRVWSAGSHTLDFLYNAFPGDFYDVTYISANPHVNRANIFFPARKFRRIVEAWRLYWDEELRTVHPSKVALAAKLMLAAGHRRLIAHFMQPHEPYIGEVKLIRGNLWQTKQLVEAGRPGAPDPMHDVDPQLLRRAYEGNLRLAISYARQLVDFARRYVDRIVVTSDHGEVLDEVAGLADRHPRGLSWPILRVVPWLEAS